VRIAIEMLQQGMIDENTVIQRIEPNRLEICCTLYSAAKA
jgi:hypothetical protein